MTTLDAAYGHRHGTASRPLVVEESTVRIHVKRILMKLDVRDRVQAVTLAYRPVSTSPLDDDPSLGATAVRLRDGEDARHDEPALCDVPAGRRRLDVVALGRWFLSWPGSQAP
jgi:Bacterial regulatory proteins, luxR family